MFSKRSVSVYLILFKNLFYYDHLLCFMKHHLTLLRAQIQTDTQSPAAQKLNQNFTMFDFALQVESISLHVSSWFPFCS